MATASHYLGQGSDVHNFKKNAYNSKTETFIKKKKNVGSGSS